MSTMRVGRVSKHRKGHRANSRSVLRMMAIMQDRNSEEVPKEFLETGRTGRRNAMPDILHPQGAEVTTSDLPSRLQQLVTTASVVSTPDFFESGRAGRRNAIPNILDSESEASVSDVDRRRLQRIISDKDNPQPGPSKTDLDVKKGDELPAKKDSCS